ncbi:MAG TPA: hypothetical protein PK530_24435, partial [Anaerolineales bacterium]|nr:hypothetical protein [Anaerolineales bacterium]
MSHRKITFLFVLVLVLAALVSACGGGAKPSISLVENSWPASELNVNVASIIIEKELGNPVEIVARIDNKVAVFIG